MQISFDSKSERDAKYRELRKLGYQVSRFVLRGQLTKWASFGVYDGSIRDVYYLNVPDQIGVAVRNKWAIEKAGA